ncbi:MAG: YbaB/EbfC family nucleoid-associated protein [Actinobacteria bacterium]|nr:YbaB/EbfC family nucleoid-associated protein [Actinomycetota bacterium]
MSFNYSQMLKQAKMVQKQLEVVNQELKNMEFEASSGGGAVRVKVNGQQEVKDIKINREMIGEEDFEMLEDMILVAINDALNQSRQAAKNKLASLTGGLSIPGLF